MVLNEQLASKIRALSKRKGLSEKKMFGGLAFMLNGNMCFGVIRENLVIRVGPDKYNQALELPHARPMDFTGRAIKGFVYVDSSGWSKEPELKKWLDMGIEYCSSLPKK